MTDSNMPPQSGGPRDPKAEAKAAKAYAKASRPWYKKKRFIFPAAFVLIIAISAGVSGGGSDDGPTAASDSSSSGDSDSGGNGPGTQGNPAAVGKTIELEGTRYTVESARTSPSVGESFMQEEAGGVYVIVELTIENTKDETKTFSDSAAKLVGKNDKQYSTDNDGTLAASGNSDPLFLKDMQPDVPTTGSLVFDVPKNLTKGAVLEVSDLFGGGAAYLKLGL